MQIELYEPIFKAEEERKEEEEIKRLEEEREK